MAAVHGKNSQASFDKVLVNIVIYFTRPNLMDPIYSSSQGRILEYGEEDKRATERSIRRLDHHHIDFHGGVHLVEKDCQSPDLDSVGLLHDNAHFRHFHTGPIVTILVSAKMSKSGPHAHPELAKEVVPLVYLPGAKVEPRMS